MIGGWAGERLSIVGSLGYELRPSIPLSEKGWALNSVDFRSRGAWSPGGNPVSLVPFTTFTPLADPDCEAVGGGIRTGVQPELCSFRYIDFMNLQEEEEHYQGFLEVNYTLTDNLSLHGELLYAGDRIDDWRSSPSYPMFNGLGIDRVVVPGMPHYDELISRNPTLAPVLGAGALLLGRTFGVSGPALSAKRELDTYRGNLGATLTLNNGIEIRSGIMMARTESRVAWVTSSSDNSVPAAAA